MNITHILRPRLLVLFIAAFSFFLFSFSQQALAQPTAGIGISPAIIEPAQQFNPGDVEQFTVEISNLNDTDQTFYLSTRDIIGVREGGVPIIATDSSQETGYEITDWLTLENSEINLKSGESTDISFTMEVPQDVSPGSHFGSIIVSAEPPKLRSSGAGIGYEVANIISIRIAGDANESARIRQFSTSKYIYGSTNVDFNVRIENEGNTLIKPIGPLEVKNMFGKQVALLNFNESQAAVFPKTASNPEGTREFDINWLDESPGFGRYEALLSVVYGEQGSINTISSTVTFWILPMNIVGPALIGLAVLFLIIFVSVKLYVRRTMAVANSGVTRRLVRSRQQNQFPVLLVFISMLAVTALFFIVLLLLFA